MKRVEAGDAYFFSREYFEDLRAKLENRLHLACVLTEMGTVAAAGLFVSTDGIVQYHLGGTSPAYLSLAPFKLVIDFMWRWAQEESHRALHLGGGVGGAEDSLFHFKAGFSSTRGEFYSYRLIVDHERNRILEQAAGIQSSSSALKQSTFFPRYRHAER
jgi:lipid II:glycine glycyltransferase (peptidoglycan interpeptide bridge formation enzyme)